MAAKQTGLAQHLILHQRFPSTSPLHHGDIEEKIV